jgi:hypothetical protein
MCLTWPLGAGAQPQCRSMMLCSAAALSYAACTVGDPRIYTHICAKQSVSAMGSPCLKHPRLLLEKRVQLLCGCRSGSVWVLLIILVYCAALQNFDMQTGQIFGVYTRTDHHRPNDRLNSLSSSSLAAAGAGCTAMQALSCSCLGIVHEHRPSKALLAYIHVCAVPFSAQQRHPAWRPRLVL